MTITVFPTNNLKGLINLPASKSYSIRAFIISSCGGTSKIIQPSNCDDAKVALSVAKSLGAKVKRLSGGVWSVEALSNKRKKKEINVGESGTALRFVLPLLALEDQRVRIVGKGTLIGRPNRFLNQTLRQMGVDIKGQGAKESVPICLEGGRLTGGTISIDGSLSSQFISALLIACPRLKEDTRLLIKGSKVVSSEYIIMTEQILSLSGVKVRRVNRKEFRIKGKQLFKGLKNFHVPSDYGLAAFSLAAAALTKSNIVLKGSFNDALIQSDGHILPFLKRMGVGFSRTKASLKIKGPFQLKGGVFSLKDCPDLVPIMAVLALFAKGKTKLCDIKHARVKESDRISDLRKELLKVGASVKESVDSLVIEPKECYKSNVLLDPHNDHRLAMAFSVLGVKTGVRIRNIECVNKSYPDFVRDFKSFGIKLRKIGAR